MRHGPTEFNDQGRLRGWMDPGLTEAGYIQAEALRAKLPDGLPVHCSDLLRARQTALQLCTQPRLEFALRPWNVGVYAGQPTAEVHPKLVEHQRDGTCPPDGELWSVFVSRFTTFLGSLRSDCILVTHYRNCKLLQAWAAGSFAYIDWSVLQADDVVPGEVLTVEVPW